MTSGSLLSRGWSPLRVSLARDGAQQWGWSGDQPGSSQTQTPCITSSAVRGSGLAPAHFVRGPAQPLSPHRLISLCSRRGAVSLSCSGEACGLAGGSRFTCGSTVQGLDPGLGSTVLGVRLPCDTHLEWVLDTHSSMPWGPFKRATGLGVEAGVIR